jgi:hypothetical protein
LPRHGIHCFQTIWANENSINLDGGWKSTIFNSRGENCQKDKNTVGVFHDKLIVKYINEG